MRPAVLALLLCLLLFGMALWHFRARIPPLTAEEAAILRARTLPSEPREDPPTDEKVWVRDVYDDTVAFRTETWLRYQGRFYEPLASYPVECLVLRSAAAGLIALRRRPQSCTLFVYRFGEPREVLVRTATPEMLDAYVAGKLPTAAVQLYKATDQLTVTVRPHPYPPVIRPNGRGEFFVRQGVAFWGSDPEEDVAYRPARREGELPMISRRYYYRRGEMSRSPRVGSWPDPPQDLLQAFSMPGPRRDTPQAPGKR